MDQDRTWKTDRTISASWGAAPRTSSAPEAAGSPIIVVAQLPGRTVKYEAPGVAAASAMVRTFSAAGVPCRVEPAQSPEPDSPQP